MRKEVERLPWPEVIADPYGDLAHQAETEHDGKVFWRTIALTLIVAWTLLVLLACLGMW